MVKRPPKDDPDQGLLDFVPERLDRAGTNQLTDKPAGGHGRLLLSVALGLAAVVATVVTVWYIFANQPAATSKGGVPVVAADQTPIKSKPVEPGGMEVPNQDKLVYDRLGHADAPAQAERLLPPPEAPKAPPAKPAKVPPSLATPKPAVENITPEAKAPPKPAANEPPPATPAPPPAVVVAENAPPPAKPAATPPAAAPAPPPVHAPEPPKAEAPKPAPPPAALAAPKAEPPKPTPTPAPQQTAAVAPPKIVPGKDAGWRIQIAAMRDTETAEKEWARTVAANRDLLGSLASDILRADLGAKGIFYRVRGGPLDEAQARKLCEELGKRKIGCMVVRK